MDLVLFNKLKKLAAKHRRRADEARGALGQIDTRLKEELGVDNLDQATKLLKRLEREAKEADAAYQAELEKVEAEFGERIREES